MSASQVRVPAVELVDGDTVWFAADASVPSGCPVTFARVTRDKQGLVVGRSVHGTTYKWLPTDEVLVQLDEKQP